MDYVSNILRAVDYIESHLAEDCSIENIAKQAFLSRYHFHRIFFAMTGDTLGDYVRKRRLTDAAERIFDTRERIVDIAFGVGFESHEAFTRAFKRQFGLPPAVFRTKGVRSELFMRKRITSGVLQHRIGGITMEPEIVEKGAIKVIGMDCRTSLKNNRIPQLWQKFMMRSGEVANREPDGAYYGICVSEEGFDPLKFTDDTEYTEFVGAGVVNFDNVPKGMKTYSIPARKYAVFTHKGPLENLGHTYNYIYGVWLPKSGYEIAGDDFELYDNRFDSSHPETSELFIHIPIK